MCETGASVESKFISGRATPRVRRHDHRLHDLAPSPIAHSHDSRLANARVREQRLLDLGRVDVLSASDDAIALATPQMDIALLVDDAQVACSSPSVRIHDERVGTAQHELAHA